MKSKITLLLFILPFLCSLKVNAQSALEDEITNPINLAGPRIGFTYLGNAYTKMINNSEVFDQMYGKNAKLGSLITQFGWQFETRFFSMPDGSCGVIEFVPMIGGLDQNIIIPSLSIIIGARLANGFEFGMGPVFNITGSSVSLVVGKNFESFGINFPLNLAITPSPDGVRGTFIVGFNKRE